MAWVKITDHECISEKVNLMAKEGKVRPGSVWECDLKACGRQWVLTEWSFSGPRKIANWKLYEESDV